MHVHASGRNYGAISAPGQQIFNAIYSGDGGDIVVTTDPAGTNLVTFTAVPAGVILPVYGRYIDSAPANSVWLDW